MNQTAICNLAPAPTFFSGAAADDAPDSDFAMAREAARGATEAVGELYVRHRGRVYSVCRRMMRNAADAEDLTQEVFVHLFKQIGTFRGESQFTTWLHRLTVNHVLMRLRHDIWRKGKTLEYIAAQRSTACKSYHSASLPVLDRIALDAALSRLPPGYRSAFVLHDIEGLSHDEIASVLGYSVVNSRSQLHRARKSLRRLLRSRGPMSLDSPPREF